MGDVALVERGVDDGVGWVEDLGDLCRDAVDLDAEIRVAPALMLADTDEVARSATGLEYELAAGRPFLGSPESQIGQDVMDACGDR